LTRLGASSLAAAVTVTGAVVLIIGATHTTQPAAAPLPSTATAVVPSPSEPRYRTPSAAATASSATLGAPGPTSAPARGSALSSAPTQGAGARAARLPSMAASAIRIPALGVTATIGHAVVDNGVLIPPRDPATVGIWAGSAALDAPNGQVTIAGHVNWAGMAPFAFGRLAYLHTGDLVYTTDLEGNQTAWRVAAVTARPKKTGIDRAAFVGTRGPRALALITCGGAFDSTDRSYLDNIYVAANLVAFS